MTRDRYFVTTDERGEREVAKVEYVQAERNAGFHNTRGQPDEPATAGFGSGAVRGRIEYGDRRDSPNFGI